MALREEYPLHPNKIIKKAIEKMFGAGAAIVALLFIILPIIGSIAGIGGGLFAAAGSAIVILLGVLLLSLAVFVVVYLWSQAYFKSYFYDLTERGIEMKKGVIFPKSIVIPLEKVSDVYVDQDIFDRVFGLYDLHFSSASLTSASLAHIDGLDKQTADALREMMMGVFRKEAKGAATQAADKPGETRAGTAGNAAPTYLAEFRPAQRGYFIELLGNAIGFVFIGIWLLLFIGPLIVLLVPIAIIWALWLKLEYDSRVYQLREDGVWIRKGWLTPSETLIFYRNIQDIDVNEPFLDRLASLKDLVIKSMSAQSAVSAQLSMLTSEDVAKLREMLQAQITNARAQEKKTAAANNAASLATATGAAAPLGQPVRRQAPVTYQGEELVKPYPNQFIKSSLISLVVPAAIGIIVLIVALVFGALIGNVLALFGIALVFIIGIGLLLLASGLIGAFINQMTYSYKLGSDGLVISLGLISRMSKVIRYDKIQDIRLACGFIESFFSLANITVETGAKDIVEGRRSSRMAINGVVATEGIPALNLADAYSLREKLLAITNISYAKNENPLCSERKLSAKKPLKKTAASVGILWVQVLFVLILAALVSKAPISAFAFAGAVILSIVLLVYIPVKYIYETMYMKKYHYDENAETLVIRKGVFGWTEIIVPFKNIQSVYVNQDWYDIVFNLWDVWITTVTSASRDIAHIDGLEKEDAEYVARLLADRVEKSRKK